MFQLWMIDPHAPSFFDTARAIGDPRPRADAERSATRRNHSARRRHAAVNYVALPVGEAPPEYVPRPVDYPAWTRNPALIAYVQKRH